jgi:hypothetical protein
MTERDRSWLGGGGIAEQDRSWLGGGGIADRGRSWLGGGGMTEQDRSWLGGGGITEPARVVLLALNSIELMLRLFGRSVTAAAEEFSRPPLTSINLPNGSWFHALGHWIRPRSAHMFPASSDVHTTTLVRSPRNRSRANSSGSPERA